MAQVKIENTGISREIRKAMKAKGLTQAELARKMNISQQRLSQMLKILDKNEFKHVKLLSLLQFQKMCDILDIDMFGYLNRH
ncbi:MAG: helix-turn-helix domain-containing protein, partial [bacterium]